jgi:hypothetical protein
MLGHRAGGILVFVAFVLAAGPIPAAEKSPWNGVWVGTLGKSSKISVTIADDKVTAYTYGGANLSVAYSKPAAAKFAFGDRANYSMVLKRIGDDSAKATYHGRHGLFVATMTKQ